MSLQKRWIALCALLCLALSANAALKAVTSNHIVIDRKERVAVEPDSMTNESLAYMRCNDSNSFRERICRIVLETLNLDGTTTETSCNLNLTFQMPGGYVHLDHHVILASKGRVLVVWCEQLSGPNADYKFSSVRMSNCEINEATIPYHHMGIGKGGLHEAHARNFALANNGDDTFTLLFQDKELCGNKYCQSSLDAEGNVGEILPWFPLHDNYYMPDKLFTVSIGSGRKENLAVFLSRDKKNAHHVEFSVVDDDGVKLHKSFDPPAEYDYGGYSVAHKLFGVCFRTEDGVQCSQFDLKGNAKFDRQNVALDNRTIVATPYNLPAGGLLIFAIECNTPWVPSPYRHVQCIEILQRYRLIKIDAQGKLSGTLKIEGFKCDYYWSLADAHFFINKAGEYCLSLVCGKEDVTTWLRKDSVNRTINCFTDDDFKIRPEPSKLL